MSISPRNTVLAVFPSMVALAVYYSLPIHMHHSLGGWPQSIGVRGFSPALLRHISLVGQVFNLMLCLSLCVALLLVGSLAVKRWRHFAAYFALYEVTVLSCFALTQFAAPAGFLTWWFD